jgi:probable blue pigment (indigoidine) exporter
MNSFASTMKRLFHPHQLLALFCATMWAAGSIGIKSGLHSAPPLYFMAMRFMSAALILGAYCVIAKSRWPRTWRSFGRHAAIGVMTNTVYMGLSAVALGTISAGLSSVAAGTNGMFLALGAAVLFGERISRRALFGMGVACMSLVAVMYSRLGTDNQPWGIATVMAANVVMVASNLLFKGGKNEADVTASQTIQLACGGTILLLIAMFSEDATRIHFDANLVASIAFLIASCSLGAMVIFLHLLRHASAAVAGSYLFMVPILGLMLGAAFGGETLTWLDLLGGMGVAGGVYLVQICKPAAVAEDEPKYSRANVYRPLVSPKTLSRRLQTRQRQKRERQRLHGARSRA